MDEPKKQPLVFANRTIRMFVDHLLNDKMVVLPRDYMALRLTFRHANGSWEQLTQGSPEDVRLLASIVKAWGKMPGRAINTENG